SGVDTRCSQGLDHAKGVADGIIYAGISGPYVWKDSIERLRGCPVENERISAEDIRHERRPSSRRCAGRQFKVVEIRSILWKQKIQLGEGEAWAAHVLSTHEYLAAKGHAPVKRVYYALQLMTACRCKVQGPARIRNF